MFKDFFRAMWADWLARMSGPFSVPAAAVAFWVSNDTAKTGFLLTAFVCVWVTAYRIWRPERERAQKLTERITPKLTAIYDPAKSQCRSVSKFRYSNGPPREGMVYRVQVKNTGGETVKDCEGQLIEVAFDEETSELGAANLTWCGDFPPLTKIDLKGGFTRELDLLIIFESGQISLTTPGWPPNNRRDFFSRHGYYRFVIVVGGDASATLPPYRLQLNYTGDWKTSTMEVIAA